MAPKKPFAVQGDAAKAEAALKKANPVVGDAVKKARFGPLSPHGISGGGRRISLFCFSLHLSQIMLSGCMDDVTDVLYIP